MISRKLTFEQHQSDRKTSPMDNEIGLSDIKLNFGAGQRNNHVQRERGISTYE